MGGGEITNSNKLYAVTPDGTQKWVFETNGWVGSPAIGADGTIYLGGYWYGFYAINPDGSQRWFFRLPTNNSMGVNTPPVIGADGTIYVGAGTGDGALYAVYSSSQGLAKSPWPMFHHDVRHTGRVAQTNMAAIMSLLLSD